MAAVQEDPAQVRAALILVSLRYRKLRRRPEWIPLQPREVSSSAAGTVAAEVMRSAQASSSARTVAARVPLRRRPERVSMQPAIEASLAGPVAAVVPEWWPKGKRSGLRGETSRELQQAAETPRVAAVLCYAAAAASGPSPVAAKPAKEASLSPNSPLDYGAGGSGAPSSAEHAAAARPQAKRKGTGAPGSVGGASGGVADDEGCSSLAKRGHVAEEAKPMRISVEPSVPSEIRASSGKGAPLPFDLNLPCPLDDD